MDSDLRKDLTTVAWIRCCGQRKDFVRELLHCVRGIRADENAEASGSGAALRLNERPSFSRSSKLQIPSVMKKKSALVVVL